MGLVFLSSAAARADCGAIWSSGAIDVTAGGSLTNIKPAPITNPSGKVIGALFSPTDPGLPAQLPVYVLMDALRAHRLVTVQASAIRVDAPLDVSQAGGGRRLTLSTDLGGLVTGAIVLGATINLAASDQIYLRGGAVDQCAPPAGNSDSLRGGHVAINAYEGVGLHSTPLPQLIVANLTGFSLYAEGGYGATIVSAGALPLEEFDRGQPLGQDAILVSGKLQIQINPPPVATHRRRR